MEATEEVEVVEYKECLAVFADVIYEAAVEDFGCSEGVKKTPETKGGLSRRQRTLAQLRKDKRDLRKRWKAAAPEEKDGLKTLYEDLKERSRDLQRKERSLHR